MHRQALEVSERVLGKEHLDTLASMNGLAIVLIKQGKYDEAKEPTSARTNREGAREGAPTHANEKAESSA